MQRPEPPKNFEQPESFAFTPENLEIAKVHIAKYPEGKQQSAVMPLLSLAQKQNANWLPVAAMEVVADMLSMPFIRVQEVATFYSMYNLVPMGRYHLQLCTTTPCWLRGSDDMLKACKDELGVGFGGTSADGMFTMSEVECLGACVNAPMMQVTSPHIDNYYEDLDYDRTVSLIRDLRAEKVPDGGSLAGRKSSEPQTGPTCLDEQKKGWKKMQKGAA